MSYGDTKPKRRRLPGKPGPIMGREPRELCDVGDEELERMLADIIRREKSNEFGVCPGHVMGPRGRTAIVNELRRRRDYPHLRRPKQ